MLLDEMASRIAKLSPKHIQQATENITRTIEDEEVLKCVPLAMDVVSHPGKNRECSVTDNDDGPKLGKEDTLRQLKAGLEKRNSMGDQGDQIAIGKAKELIKIAINIIAQNLDASRGGRALGVAANVASIAANIAGVMGISGASLIPWLINVTTANLASASNIAQEMVRKIYAIEGEIFGGKVVKLGKKETKRLLWEALRKLDGFIQNETDLDQESEFRKIQQNIKKASIVVGSKLSKARTIKGFKIAGAVLATAAAIAAGGATFG
jgi:hypothetical protein